VAQNNCDSFHCTDGSGHRLFIYKRISDDPYEMIEKLERKVESLINLNQWLPD